MHSIALIEIKILVGIVEVTMGYMITVLIFMFTVASPQCSVAANARKGETLAQRWCASCHIISSDQIQGTTQAPPFSAIAGKTDFNETMLAYFLLTPHPRMPDISLSRSEAEDLAAYIKMQR
jgi:mono/diheme cytochrome c family protein